MPTNKAIIKMYRCTVYSGVREHHFARSEKDQAAVGVVGVLPVATVPAQLLEFQDHDRMLDEGVRSAIQEEAQNKNGYK